MQTDVPSGSRRRGRAFIFSFVGYERPKSGAGSSRTTIDISPKIDQKLLEEVVIVGTAHRKIGTYRFCSHCEYKKSPSPGRPWYRARVTGRIPGVQVTQNSGSGRFAESPHTRQQLDTVRNDPLYVIDGFPIEGSSVFLNPNDVERR